MKAIYKMNFDCRRSGILSGIFVADDEDVKTLIDSMIEVHFGEVLGKHSDVYGPIDKNDIERLTDNPEFVEMFEKHGMATGHNPFWYPALTESLPAGIEGFDDMYVYDAVKAIRASAEPAE